MTLIEVLIYIFIFSIVVGGAIATAFWTYESTARTSRIGLIESEADFVLRKIDWASTGSSIITPTSGNTGSVLTFLRDGTTYTFQKTGDEFTLSIDYGTQVPLTTDNVVVDSFSAKHIGESGGSPAAASTTISINGVTYGPKIKYVR